MRALLLPAMIVEAFRVLWSLRRRGWLMAWAEDGGKFRPFSMDYIDWRMSTVYSEPGKSRGDVPGPGDVPGKNRWWLHWRRMPGDIWNFLKMHMRLRLLRKYK